MSMADGEERHPEIIIVRRGGDDVDEGHHGGVWKIAFADFMTAMMCFFLVMWLINAANEQTRAALASYFNPVKLIDRNTNRKGLEEIGQGPQATSSDTDAEKITNTPAGENDKTSGPSTFKNSADLADTRKYSDQNFFSNPYSVLAEIAADIGTEQNISEKGEGGQQDAGPSSGASGGEAYRDPFAPDFWSQQVAVPQIGVEGDPDEAREQPAGADAEATETGKHLLTADEAEFEPESQQEEIAALAPVPQVEPLAGQSKEAEQARDIEEAQEAEITETREKTADAVRAEIMEALESEGLNTSVAVTSGEDGVLISVTDEVKNGMFAVGSAVPVRQLVLAMEKIGRTLAERPGAIRVHGHTDARPFNSGDYDNWRLSTARAHAAQYMLVRGGLNEARIAEVAGFADRRLKLPDDPLADANRRIDILLEVPR
ncbi:MotB family protein [Chelativorans salis]|uniref:MotB family protein n=1 Tax=Chelativorans salis TaxID=2978478 RepID=A0ABT2LSP4_9HYPH|nr:MotB family protein [Chelativorans sp. EGI FJ00035]MCT7377567.1 MotB family protein [Chelativorans sp. EGI FJ00035]